MSESSDLTDHVTCTIKASVNLQIGDTKTEISQSGVSVVDINLPFGKTVNIEDVTFKNYFCIVCIQIEDITFKNYFCIVCIQIEDITFKNYFCIVCIQIEDITFKNYYCIVCIQIEDVTFKNYFCIVCIQIEDITFKNYYCIVCIQIEDITFKNYYCAFVSVRVLKRTPGQEAQWSTALRDLPLMENPHTEAGSQDYYSIHRDQMLLVPDNVVSVRLVLRQPSSAWLTFNLEDIKIHPHTQPAPVKEVSDWLSDLTLVDQHLNMEGLPDPQAVSSSIQQMWALTEVMQTNQTTASIGRFDVDGCYDINLLCLT
uniref:Nicolin 1 n=1 Tax=Gadus morhua TaxID=8049 RepID=A0A8C4ZP00_GADMO